MTFTNWGSYYWPVYLTVAALFFLFPEFAALFTNAANTLSDYCWKELGVNVAFGNGRHTVAWWLSQGAWVVFVVLITIHIWYRGV